MIHGKSPQLLNVTYVRPSKFTEDKECFEVIYYDDDGNLRKSDESPEVDIYFTKPELREPSTYHRPEVRLDRLEKHRVPFSKIKKEIENEMGEIGHQFYRSCIAEQRYRDLDDLYLWPHSFRADFQPEFYYRHEWHRRYGLPSKVKLTKAFMDIEVDQIDDMTNFDDIANSAVCPVNCTTLIFEESKEVFTFVLRPYEPGTRGRDQRGYQARLARYRKQLATHGTIMSDLPKVYDKLHELFDRTYGELSYEILEFESEIELIRSIFKHINDRKPNFCLTWNMRFDIQYLYHRIKQLGYDPAEIMCHPEFKRRTCYFKQDKAAFDIKKQCDYFYCSSYTMYICQMRTYAGIRKNQHALKSTKLDYIASLEMGDRKLTFDEDDENLTLAAYNNWLRFIIYNIKDVLLQLGIERVTNDAMTYYMRSLENCTPYQKVFRETHLLRNVREMYFNEDGWTQGNNVNLIYLKKEAARKKELFNRTEEELEALAEGNGPEDDEGDEGSFKGAINADPIMNAKVGVKILGRPSNTVYRNAMDFDMSAFYPSIKVLSNMSAVTLIAKAAFINDEFKGGEMTNRSLNQIYEEYDKHRHLRQIDITGEAINTFLTGNLLTFGYNWLNYPDIFELYTLVKRELSKTG